jgi:hypothetical protein
MSKKTQHTPTPWKVVPNLYKDFPLRIDGQPTEETPCGFSPCAVFGDGTRNRGVAEANAARIVACVNAHDELVKALENLVRPLSRGWKVDDMPARIAEAEAALAKCGENEEAE